MIFYTADTHFGHANILRLCDRPFASVGEMNEKLIERWNEKVQPADTVYILGDMFFRTTEIESILERLRGKKHLIVGNHDDFWMHKVDLENYFLSVSSLLETSDGAHGVVLCHYPLLSWKSQRKNYMIHGHIHADTTMDFFPLLCAREKVLNAGVDVNGFEPVSLDELIENNRRFKENFLSSVPPVGRTEEGWEEEGPQGKGAF